MTDKISISLVSYLNTKPFLYGLEHASILPRLDLQLDIPSVGGKKILNNEVDIGLVPVAVLAQLNDAQIITDYCIGANGPVKSVSIYSEVPIDEIENIYLDYHSLTSVQLVKLLLREYWKITPMQLDAPEDYIDRIKGTTAGLVIGDRALMLNKKMEYVYDLSEAWKNLTGLPFVFAAWVTRKKQFADNIFEINEALKYGVHNIDRVAEAYQSDLLTKSELEDYLKNNIDFHLDATKRRALDLFLSMIRK
ncbi:MAG: menaquinone biosynthetic enzyme MqnA/MqnD family protein [Chitinophagales bacterium]